MGIFVRGLIVLKSGSLAAMDEDSLHRLGQRLRDRRKARGWTQEELATHAGIDRSYIGGVERGRRNLTFTVLCQIALALGSDVADLTSDIPAPKP